MCFYNCGLILTLGPGTTGWIGLKSGGPSHNCPANMSEWGWFEGDNQVGGLNWLPSQIYCSPDYDLEKKECSSLYWEKRNYKLTVGYPCSYGFPGYFCEFY